MRLRFIETVDFRFSEITNYKRLAFVQRKALRGFGPNDVVCLLSKRRDQIVFVHGFTNIDEASVLRSERLRIVGGRWSPLMLQNYANEVGLRLDGIKRFEEHMREMGYEIGEAIREGAGKIKHRKAA